MPPRILSPAERARLTATEKEVLTLVAAGMLSKEVASRLGIRPGTVAQHLEHIGSRLDTRSRTEYVRTALSTGQISAPVLPGDVPDFSDTELTLLHAYTRYCEPDAVATAAGLAQHHVGGRVGHLVKKAGARNRTHLLALAHAWGLAGGQPTTSGRRALLTALLSESASGGPELPAAPGTGIIIGNRPRSWAGWTPQAPDRRDVPTRLASALALHDIHADVETVRPAPTGGPGFLRITLEPADDIAHLVAEITAELITEAVRVLSAAFRALGITDGQVRPRGLGGLTVRDLGPLDAQRLYSLLAADPHGAPGEENTPDPDDLTRRLGPLLSAASGGPINPVDDPVCSSCTVGRPRRIAVGSLTPAQAGRLAAHIHQALAAPRALPGVQPGGQHMKDLSAAHSPVSRGALTFLQQAVLHTIEEALAESRSPTTAEIHTAIPFSTESGAEAGVRYLKKHGLLTWKLCVNRRRQFVVLAPAPTDEERAIAEAYLRNPSQARALAAKKAIDVYANPATRSVRAVAEAVGVSFGKAHRTLTDAGVIQKRGHRQPRR